MFRRILMLARADWNNSQYIVASSYEGEALMFDTKKKAVEYLEYEVPKQDYSSYSVYKKTTKKLGYK